MSKRKSTTVLTDQESPTKKPRLVAATKFLEYRADGQPWVGAHISAAKGVSNAVPNTTAIHGNSAGLFVRSQRKWVSPPLPAAEAKKFTSCCHDHGFDPKKHFLPHGSYLINLGNPDPERRKKSYEGFLDELSRCEQLGIGHYNFHPGSTCGECTPKQSIGYIAENINKAIEATSFVVIVLECMSGQKNKIGSRFEDLRDIIELVSNKERVGVCLDTCHMFAAGYDIRTPEAWNATMETFEKVIGLKYLKALHVNDSKEGLGSGKDRHEELGKGKIGLSAFRFIMNDPRFYSIPLVLETPISADKHAKEIELLYSFVGKTTEADYEGDKEFSKLIEENRDEGECKKKRKRASKGKEKSKGGKSKEKKEKTKSRDKKEKVTKKKASKKQDDDSSEEWEAKKAPKKTKKTDSVKRPTKKQKTEDKVVKAESTRRTLYID